MTDTNERLRALFLAALMVMSVFAMTVALTGSAAANHDNTGDSADEHLESGGTYWQGQVLFVDAEGQQNADGEVQVRAVDSDGGVGGLEKEVVVGASDNATVTTSNLDGDYVLVNDTYVLDVVDGDVTGSGRKISHVDTAENASDFSFEVAVQTLSANFDDDDLPVREGDVATIEMDSNRGTYTVNVSAEGLDEDDLEDIFNVSFDNNDVVTSPYNSVTDDDDASSIQINTTSEGTIEANFSSFAEAGSYTFDFDVADTDAEASASVEVQEEDVTLDFSQGIYSDQVGDATTFVITLEDTNEAFVYVGSNDVNYLERVHVVDDDEDGVVVLTMNTFKAGREETATESGYGQDYLANDNDNNSIAGEGYLIPSDYDDEIQSITRFNSSDFDSGSGIDISRNLTTPLEEGSYDLTLAAVSSNPDVDADDGDVNIPNEEDVATLELSERSTNGIRTLVGPTGSVDIDPDDEEDVNELLGSAIPADTATVGGSTGDVLLVQVNASGTTGYISDNSGVTTIDTAEATDFARATGVYFNITREGPNQGEIRVNLDSSAVQLINFPSPAETFYVALDLRSVQTEAGNNLAAGTTWTASFQVGNEDATSSPNFYVATGEEERVETSFTLQDPDAEFNNIADGDLQVAQDTNASVSGSSNLPPGEEVTVRLRKTGDSPFLRTQTVEVGANGAWEASFDTSDIPLDTEFTASVREGSTTISDEVDAVIVESATPTPTTTAPPDTTTAPPDTTTAPPDTTTAPPDTTTAPPDTTESGGQPGFGVAIAIVALLGAALLALRRRD